MGDEFTAHCKGKKLGDFCRVYGHPVSSMAADHTHETVMTVGRTSVNAMALPAKSPNGEYHDHVWHADIEDVIASGGVMRGSVDNDHSHDLTIPPSVELGA